MREYHYRVDPDGRVYHDGAEILDPPTLRFFLLAMTRTDDGRWLAVCQGERNWFDADPTPFVVQRVRLDTDDRGLTRVELRLAGDYAEPLDPDGLEAAAGHLSCRVRKGRFPARFGRVAVQQLAPFLVDTGAGPCLLLGGREHPIRGAASARRPSPPPSRRGLT